MSQYDVSLAKLQIAARLVGEVDDRPRGKNHPANDLLRDAFAAVRAAENFFSQLCSEEDIADAVVRPVPFNYDSGAFASRTAHF